MMYGPPEFYDDNHAMKRRGLIPTYTRNPGQLIHVQQMPKSHTLAAVLTLKPVMGDDIKASLKIIMELVSAHFEVPLRDLTDASRFKRHVRPRMIYYWLARELTPASLYTIGRECGGRDHTTVLSGIRKIKSLMPHYQDDISAIRKQLEAAE